MTADTFYTDHWRSIEDERIARYEQMFVWRDGHAELLAPLDLVAGSRVMDYGCGPGFVALGMAGLVGAGGQVFGIDINERFVADANRRGAAAGNVSCRLIEDGRIPLDDGAVDRALAKNVLEYVPDVGATLREIYRVLGPGGRILVLDSDWGFVIVEPWGKESTERFFDAAAPAFREPHIGRRLRGLLVDAGFTDVQVTIRAGVDTEGGSLLVLRNMATYARTFDAAAGERADRLLVRAERAIAEGRYLYSLPQFQVTALRPEVA